MACLSSIPLPQSATPVDFDPFSMQLHRVMAVEMREIREQLEGLAQVLVVDDHFVTAYIEQLQSFDYLIQHAEECANLMDRIALGENSLEAVKHVRLGAVQERLRIALGGC